MQNVKIKTQNHHSTKLTIPKANHRTTSSLVLHPSSIVRRGMNNQAQATRFIPLTQGQFAIVDADDYDRLSQHKWYANKTCNGYYAMRSEKRKTIFMHREIIYIPAGYVCDHINHNRLDNRKCNLRSCTPSQNAQNRLPSEHGTSRYKGVSWDKDKLKWRAMICYQNDLIHIGYFDYEQDAAIAYDDMAIELFGEFACLNFHYRPEIRQWMQDCYLFPPMEVDSNSLSSEIHPSTGCFTAQQNSLITLHR